MNKMMFVFNPKSGKARIKSDLFYITDSFVREGWSVRVHPTQSPRDAYEQIKREGKRYDLIVASGGDGTLRESIEGLMTITEEKRPRFGYIPSGTVNDFASALNIPKSPRKAVRAIIDGKPLKFDVAESNGNYFTYVAAFGAFTEASYETPQNIKNALGRVAYFLTGIKSLANMKSYKMKVRWDGNETEGEYFLGLVTNVDHVGGIKTRYNENSQINDGLFEVILIKTPKSIADISVIVAELMSSKLGDEHFVQFSAGHMVFESEDRIKWTYDGEFAGEKDRLEINVIPRAIEIMIGGKNVSKGAKK